MIWDWKSITFVVFLSVTVAQKYNVCTTPQNLNACEQLNRTEDLRCLLRKNAVDCLLMVENGAATITSVSAEEAFLASSLTSNLVVLGEFIDRNTNGFSEFETVIMVRRELSNGFNSLKGLKFCHPGIDIMPISPQILKEFEMEALLQNNIEVCTDNDSMSLVEHYINALNDFFGPSCRPGRWTIANTTLDFELKQKYSKLTELCQTMAYQENHQHQFLQSLNCLLNGEGDLALTTMSTIVNHPEYQSNAFNNYTLLCKNGSHVNVTSRCSWTTQPWPLLIGNRESVENLPQELRNWFQSYLYDPIMLFNTNSTLLELAEKHVQNLKEIIFPTPFYLINITDSTPNLAAYIKEFRDVPTTENSRLCKSTIGLCVTPAEEQKCKWLQQAALNYGVQPVIDCVSKTSKFECLKAVNNIVADITVADTNMLYTISRWNLSIIAFAEEKREKMTRTVLVVNTTKIKTLDDLEGKTGFFSEYGDIAWLAFADTLKKTVWSNTMDYDKDINIFLNDSCMPGIKDPQHKSYLCCIDFDKACAMCGNDPSSSSSSTNCKTDSSNICYGSSGALRCLNLTGDFAVLPVTGNLALPNNTNVMCKNGSLSSTSTPDVDDACALSVTVGDQIIGRNFNSKNRDIELLLQEFDERFAAQTHTSFKIYDQFGNVKDLIFKDTTLGIEVVAASSSKYATAQLEMFENIPPRQTLEDQKASGSLNMISFLILFISLLLSLG